MSWSVPDIEGIVAQAASANNVDVRWRGNGSIVEFAKVKTQRETGRPQQAALDVYKAVVEARKQTASNGSLAAPVVFSVEVGSNGARIFYCAASWDIVWNHFGFSAATATSPSHNQPVPNVYEVIHSGGPVKLAFDLEWQREKHPYGGADVLPHFEAALCKYLKKKYGIRDVKPGRDMLVATATRATSADAVKESYHYTIPAVTVPNWSKGHKTLSNGFAEYIRRKIRHAACGQSEQQQQQQQQQNHQKHPWSVLLQSDDSLVMDEKVYTSNRNWRTLYSTKRGSNNSPPHPLVPYRRAWIPVDDEDAQADPKELFMDMLVSVDAFLTPPRHPLKIVEPEAPSTTQRRYTPTSRHSGGSSQPRRSIPRPPANRTGLSGQKLEEFAKELQRHCEPLRGVNVRITSTNIKDDGTVFVNFKPCPFGCDHQSNNSFAQLPQPHLQMGFAIPGTPKVQQYHVAVKCHSRRCRGKRCSFQWTTQGF